MIRTMSRFVIGLAVALVALPGVASAAEAAVKGVCAYCGGHCPLGCC